MDSNPIQPSVSTPVVVELHKEDQQATGGPTSLGFTSRHDASANLTTEVDLGKYAFNDSISKQQDMNKGNQNYPLNHIFEDDSDEEVHAEKLTELLVKSLQPELSKLLSSHDFSISLPTKLKELPSKFNELTGEVKELKKHVHDLEIKLLEDLKEIPNKLQTFTSTVKNLLKSSSQPEGELIKKDKGKESMSFKDAEEEKLKVILMIQST
ncbi:hypothetical protein Tco_1494680 [Tanacetum coccineum]